MLESERESRLGADRGTVERSPMSCFAVDAWSEPYNLPVARALSNTGS